MYDIEHKAFFLSGWNAVATHAKEREDISFGDPLITHELVGMKLALIHGEVSEALEAYRKNLEDDHVPGRSGIEVELADAVIRIMGLGLRLGLDLPGAILDKIDYNDHRADHKPEARNAEHGKRF